jgi:hypothetical protein
VSLDEQRSLYTRAKLNKHSESNFHTRREQVKRAFDIDKDDGQCKCPCCPADDKKLYLQDAFLTHMESEHEVALNSNGLCIGRSRYWPVLVFICNILPECVGGGASDAEARKARGQDT